MSENQKKFVIDCLSNYIRTALLIDGRLVELIIEDRNDEPRTGDIYAARVKDIVKKQYAFIDIGAEKNGFMHLDGRNIQQGQALTVFVEKPAYAEKGCALSLDISLSGRLAAVTNDGKPVGISHKITDDETRKRLAEAAKSVLPNGFSCIVRTNAAESPVEELQAEISALSAKLLDILEKGQYAKPPCRLYRQEDDALRLIRDCYADGDEIISNDREYFDILSQKYTNVTFYDGALPLFAEYGIETKADKLLERKVWLDCGGFLIFDYTEAMTVIDVNSGKFTDGKDMRKTALKANLQAAKEIACQIRLRNISGIIAIDFVNMKHKEDIELLEETLREAISHDRLKTTYAGITSLGIAMLTRQKQSVPLHSLLMCGCKACKGSGETRSPRYICGKVRNDVINIFAQTVYKGVVIKANSGLIDEIKKYADLENLADKYQKNIAYEIMQTGAYDYYEVEIIR